MTAPEAAAGNRRSLIMALGGVGLLLVVFLGSRLLGGGGDGEPTAQPPASPGVTQAPTTTTTTLPGPADLETFEVFTTKNPFIPLSGAGSGGGGTGGSGTGGGGTGGGGTGGSGTGGGGTGGGGTGGGGTGGSGGSGTGSGSSAEPVRSERVSLLEIFVEGGRTVANVRVNDTVYKVGAGDAFASRYRVVSLSQAEGCGRFLFGDDQFRLCRGEQVLK